jgi:hypothetical protein
LHGEPFLPERLEVGVDGGLERRREGRVVDGGPVGRVGFGRGSGAARIVRAERARVAVRRRI